MRKYMNKQFLLPCILFFSIIFYSNYGHTSWQRVSLWIFTEVGKLIIGELFEIVVDSFKDDSSNKDLSMLKERINNLEKIIRSHSNLLKDDYNNILNYLNTLNNSISNLKNRTNTLEYRVKNLENEMMYFKKLFHEMNKPISDALKRGVSKIILEDSIPYSVKTKIIDKIQQNNLFLSKNSPYFITIKMFHIDFEFNNQKNCNVEELGNTIFLEESETNGCKSTLKLKIVIMLRSKDLLFIKKEIIQKCSNETDNYQVTNGYPFFNNTTSQKKCDKDIINSVMIATNSIENELVEINNKFNMLFGLYK